MPAGTNAHCCIHALGSYNAVDGSAKRIIKFQRISYPWVPGHSSCAFIGSRVQSMLQSDSVTWQRTWPHATIRYMAAHQVGLIPLAPGTGFLQMARAATDMIHAPYTTSGTIRFTNMLYLDDVTAEPTLRLHFNMSHQTVSIEAYSRLDPRPASCAIINSVVSDSTLPEASTFNGPEPAEDDIHDFYTLGGDASVHGEFRCVALVQPSRAITKVVFESQVPTSEV